MLQFLQAQANHAKCRDFVDRASQIGTESCLHGGNCKFIHTQSSKERVATYPRDQFLFSGDDSGLWPAQKFVPTEHDQRDSGVNALLHQRLGDAICRQVDEASRTEIFDEWQVRALAERNKFVKRRLFGETADREI